MWQRFTERARRVVFFAQEEAGRLGENYVSTEHLLLGLIRENDSVAARVLDRLGISFGRIRSEIERQITRGSGRLGQDMQLTPRSKRVIDLAYDEARQLSNNYIGTEHLLLGLIREGEGLAGRVLAKVGADLEQTRTIVRTLQFQMESESTISWPQPASSPVKEPVGGSHIEKQFAQEFEKLSVEQQTQMHGDGIALNQLPQALQALVVELFVPGQHRGGCILDPQGMVRAAVFKIDGATSYTVSAKASFITNFLTPSPPQPSQTPEAVREAEPVKDETTPGRPEAQKPEAKPSETHTPEVKDSKPEGKAAAEDTTAQSGQLGWQRFTERARRVVFYAQEEATKYENDSVSPEHLLLGTLRENDSVAARILSRMGLQIDRLRKEVEKQAKREVEKKAKKEEGRSGQDMQPSASGKRVIEQLSASGKRVIDLAYDEARQLSNNYIGTEHLLLGLIREGLENGSDLNGRVLKKFKVDLERTRREVIALQDNDSGVKRPQSVDPERAFQHFHHVFQRLAPEQQTMLQTEGMAYSLLPAPLLDVAHLLKIVVERSYAGANSAVHVFPKDDPVVRIEFQDQYQDQDVSAYAIMTDVTLLTNFLVKDT